MTDTIATDNPFSKDEQETMQALAGLIIPASTEFHLPGADDPTIFANIVRAAADNVGPVQAGVRVAQAIGAPLDTAVSELEGRAELAPYVSVVMQCYYQDDRVMESLGMEARPPFPKGFEVPEGDWSMLEAVQKRGKIWRDA